jgi:DNA-binding CsgD family transcriptional regulator
MGPGSQSLRAWVEWTLADVDERLGFANSSLLLVLAPAGRSPRRAIAGATRGIASGGLARYFADWADADPFATPAAWEMFESRGCASLADLYPGLGHAQRRFVDDFLASLGIGDQLSLRLPGNGVTDAYLTVHEPARIDSRPSRALRAVAPQLTDQLRSFLPHGLPESLSPRERQASELVAFGLTNAEIAQVMNVGPDTVKKHLLRTTAKLGLERRTQLAVAWTTGRPLILP